MSKFKFFNMQTYNIDCLSAIYAGFLISIGCGIYLTLYQTNSIIGALLFSLGLYTIIVFKLKLFTGRIGYLPPNLLPILFGNYLGVAGGAAVIGYTRPDLIELSQEICLKKLDLPLSTLLLKAFMCGVLMFVAVEGYKRSTNPLFVIMSIGVFILCGFEHCIADIGYFVIADISSAAALGRIGLIVLGNTLGSLFLSIIMLNFIDKEQT